MENDKTGSRRIWLGFIGGGILATALGFCALDLAPAASSASRCGDSGRPRKRSISPAGLISGFS